MYIYIYIYIYIHNIYVYTYIHILKSLRFLTADSSVYKAVFYKVFIVLAHKSRNS